MELGVPAASASDAYMCVWCHSAPCTSLDVLCVRAPPWERSERGGVTVLMNVTSNRLPHTAARVSASWWLDLIGSAGLSHCWCVSCLQTVVTD